MRYKERQIFHLWTSLNILATICHSHHRHTMQSSTSLPIDFYSVDFPINDMTSLSEAVNAPLWQSGQDPSLSATGIADTSAFSLRSASVEYVHSG